MFLLFVSFTTRGFYGTEVGTRIRYVHWLSAHGVFIHLIIDSKFPFFNTRELASLTSPSITILEI